MEWCKSVFGVFTVVLDLLRRLLFVVASQILCLACSIIGPL